MIATPIGNLEDITYRAVNCLKKVNLVFAEDTRSFGILKQHFAIEVDTLSLFEQNETGRIPQAIELLKEGHDIALVSEAGTPLISDPGYRLVKQCRAEGLNVCPIPGPSAFVCALSVSGLETDQFTFLGFLPVKDGKKKKVLSDALNLNTTFAFYESPHRIEKSLKALTDLSPDRQVFLAREMTKIYEDFFLGSAAEILSYLTENNKIKGEFCIIVGKEAKKNKIN